MPDQYDMALFLSEKLRTLLLAQRVEEKSVQSLQGDLPGIGIGSGTAQAHNHLIGQNAQLLLTGFRGGFIAPAGAEDESPAVLLQRIEQGRAEQWSRIVGRLTPHAPYLACLEAIEHHQNIGGATLPHSLTGKREKMQSAGSLLVARIGKGEVAIAGPFVQKSVSGKIDENQIAGACDV